MVNPSASSHRDVVVSAFREPQNASAKPPQSQRPQHAAATRSETPQPPQLSHATGARAIWLRNAASNDEPLGYDGNKIDPAFQIGPTKPRSARRSPDENASQPSAVQGGSTKRAKTECRTRIAPSLKRRSLEPPAEGISLTSGKRANLEPQCVKSRPTSLLRVSANNDAHPCSSSSVCSVRVNPMEVAEVQGKGWSSGETATPPISTPASSITRALQVCVAHLRESQNGFRSA